MKYIQKKLLDELIAANREYWRGGSSTTRCANAANAIEKATNINFCSIWDFISAIICTHGIFPKADNKTIYTALKVLGWEVIDE